MCYLEVLSILFLFYFFITYRRCGQSTSYNVAHPACGHKGSTHLSPVHAYEFMSRCRFSTPTPRQLMVELFVLASSRIPLRKPEEKFTPAESRTHKFRLSGRTLYPLDLDCCCVHHINRSGPNHIHKQKKHCTRLPIRFVVCWSGKQIEENKIK